MEKDNNYFGTKPESEKMRNVANIVHDIVNAKRNKPELEVTAEEDAPEEPEVDPVVELVGKALSAGKPKGFFMQGVQTDDNPKL